MASRRLTDFLTTALGGHLFGCGCGARALLDASEANTELQFGGCCVMLPEAGATKLKGCSLDGFRPVELQL
jgi:hypothetical protein